jgi:hypothetical protein
VTRRLTAIALAGLLFAACTSGGDEPPAREAAGAATAATGSGGGDHGPTGSTGLTGSTGSTGSELERDTLLPKDASFVALSRNRYAPMWEEPGKGNQPDFALDTYNDYDESVPMLIEHATMRDGEPWYQVLLPLRPNGSSAWVRDRDVKVREREDRLEVDLSDRTLRRYSGDDVIEKFHIGIGTGQYPTTKGQFYVFIKVPYDDPNQPYGIMALGLSGFSRVITDWPGGGRIAVHGTPYASNRGEAVSHGCVRVYNSDMEHLTDLPLGTPVEIHE